MRAYPPPLGTVYRWSRSEPPSSPPSSPRSPTLKCLPLAWSSSYPEPQRLPIIAKESSPPTIPAFNFVAASHFPPRLVLSRGGADWL